MAKELSPAQQLETFLKFIDLCASRYNFAYGNVALEDKRLQDLLHEIEFAPGKAERNRAATKLHHSRQIRRDNKDDVQRYELIVKFFEDQNNRRTLNQLKQLLGQQRKEEEYLSRERTYKPRVE